ncbi:hypothetical protein CVT24_003175 [Panaeolus cyanescens]|uniref:Uncharacterized protein n=1 Tax=Panaeolus cyanescens TaxID=181874 RepID=A0A409VNS0_9AGAR|nr:hypothetical protein CVT24_003175 [Panaeolus cyanescens]
MSTPTISTTTTGFELDLSGYFTDKPWNKLEDKDYTSFKLMVLPSGVVYGSGDDLDGRFVVTGALIGDDIRLAKSYTEPPKSKTLKFIGKRLTVATGNVYQFAGAWGHTNSKHRLGLFVFSGVARGGSIPTHPIEGQWYVNITYVPTEDNLSGNYGILSSRVGSFTHGSDPSAPKHRMAVFASRRQRSRNSNSGSSTDTFSVIGIGADDIGTFKITGSTKCDGSWEVIKYYDDSGVFWDYRGKFDGEKTISGVWRHIIGMIRGTFTLVKQQKLDTLIAMQNMPRRGDFGVTFPATLPGILRLAASHYSQGISVDSILNLTQGFRML